MKTKKILHFGLIVGLGVSGITVLKTPELQQGVFQQNKNLQASVFSGSGTVASGKAGVRKIYLRPDKGFKGSAPKEMTPELYLELANAAIPSKVETYTNKNGHEVFAGYKSGKLSTEKISKIAYEKRRNTRNQFKPKVEEGFKFSAPRIENKTEAILEAGRAKHQKRISGFKYTRKYTAADSVKIAKEQKALIRRERAQMARASQPRLNPTKSRIAQKSAENISISINGKKVSMGEFNFR